MKLRALKIVSIILVLPFVFQFIKEKRRKSKIRRTILADGEDFSVTAKNIANSIGKSRDLYKNLITKVHPDRFVDGKKERATELSSKITKSKKNFDELTRLKVEVEDFLKTP